MAGVAQRTVYRMRRQVEEKLARLPLKFYDARTHGEIMSRAVNDMDNISNTLQQSLTQLITSVVTLVGVIVLMLTISPLLTLVVLVTLPLSICVTMVIAKRSQSYFARQQRALGELNGHVEEMYTGHRSSRRSAARTESVAKFDEHQRRALRRGLARAVRLRHDLPADDVHRQPRLCLRRRHRRHHGHARRDRDRRHAGVHPVRAAVLAADHPARQHRQHHPVDHRLGRARLRAARRGGGDAGAGTHR